MTPQSTNALLSDARTAAQALVEQLEAVVNRLEEAQARVASLQTLALSLCRTVSRRDDDMVLVAAAAFRALEKVVRE